MSAVSPILRKTIQELFALPSLGKFALGGGTNLALQYNHRISDDIDLFSPDIIGTAGYEEIVKEVKDFYGDKVFGINYPCDLNEQFTFLRFFIIADGMNIKVEVIQNMKHLDPVEKMDDIRYFSKKDIGLFKLSCAVNRSSKKDIYDLDFITNDIPLVELYQFLQSKTEQYCEPEDKSIFDLDGISAVKHPEKLLEFDNIPASTSIPAHTHDNINIVVGGKTFIEAKIEWRSKMRRLYEYLGRQFPGPKGISIR